MTDSWNDAGKLVELKFSSRRGTWMPVVIGQSLPARNWMSVGTLLRVVLFLIVGMVGVGSGWLAAVAATSWTPNVSSWVPGEAQSLAILKDAVPVGAEDGLPLYACRASVGDNIELGRFRRDFAGCHVGLNGVELEAAPFWLLGSTWADSVHGLGPSALIAGSMLSEADDAVTSPVFVCRATFRGATHVGYTSPSMKGCSIGFGGKQIKSEDYTVLQSTPWMGWAVAAAGSLPTDAIVGGEEGGEPFLICRSATRRGLLAGKIKASASGCSIANGNVETVERVFDVLVPRWQVSTGGSVPTGGFLGGINKANILFPCRVKHRGTLQPGRVNDALGGCRVGMKGSESIFRDYEILVQ